MTDPEHRQQQAAVTRLLLYYLNAPIAENCRLRGVLPAPGAVRVAVHAGDDEEGATFHYEIPHDAVAPYYIPGLLRTVLAGTQLYGSDDISEAMGMTVIHLHPEKITPDPEPDQGQALTALRALSDPGEDEHPFLVGFLMLDNSLMRLYVQRPDQPGIIGADTPLTGAPTALIASLPTLIDEEQYQRPAADDPHCDLLADLTNWQDRPGDASGRMAGGHAVRQSATRGDRGRRRRQCPARWVVRCRSCCRRRCCSRRS
ncbi:hypothetical protein [Streptomyces sp. NBC_00299]|uniref:hypothetical protein n=1 Tax=Streptomyces sp. NBC_00299 TaxID=2975705 RepID=UPI002E2997A6|nr:hypothetical protein [Streptomyces sp. NBC_00299]